MQYRILAVLIAEVGQTVQLALQSWDRTARLCLLVTVAAAAAALLLIASSMHFTHYES